ncbi:MAG: DUF4374 domain-containing protein, partial [Bacteroides sp.]|nr:DUF4374 domain-containing protein [Bacteroides sp.]
IMGLYSCDDDIEKPDGSHAIDAGTFFISVMGDESEYLMLSDNIESGEIVINTNIGELELAGYTWIFNTKPSAAIGLIYNQGDPGVGLGYGVSSEGTLEKIASFQITTRFTSYGFFDKYAVTSVGGQTLANTTTEDAVLFNFIDLENGFAMQEKAISTLNITGNGDQATFSGIVDMGDGTFLTGLVVSQPKDENATGGASTGTVNYPDSVWVAAFDVNLNLKRLYRSDKLSYSAGRYRSQYYSQIGKTDAGIAYVFSGSYYYNNTGNTSHQPDEPTNPAGALRILPGAEDFDSSYYFNIEEKSGGHRFRKIWYITDSYFLLEMYNHVGVLTGIDDPASQYAVVNMEDKTFAWVKGDIPEAENVSSTGQPMAYQEKMYFPMKALGEDPAIYIIDPVTAKATKGAVFKGAASVRAIGRLVE